MVFVLYRLWFILGLVISNSTYAQVDSITLIQAIGPEAHILSEVSQGQDLKVRSSENQISELLSNNIGVQIQGQGGSYLRTALYRGQSARHMAILWEGANIQNQFNGTYDLGLIPVQLFGDSQWYDGNYSANLGTAAMSGALVLQEDRRAHRISVGALFNDQGNKSYYGKLNIVSDKLSQSIGWNIWDHANEFRYKDFTEVRKRKQSEHLQNDLTYNLKYKWKDNVQSKISYWYQSVERSLPPSIIATTVANQYDTNHRLSLSNIWQVSAESSVYTALTYMNEYIGFFQPGIASESRSNIWNLNSKWKNEGSITQTAGLNIRYEEGELVDTINPSFQSFFPSRLTTALFYSADKKIDQSTFNFSARQELIGSEWQVPTAQLSYSFDQSSDVNYFATIGNSFSYPGFNDLYWPTGGNINLKTEKAYQLEMGASIYGLQTTAYWINTTDKIVWSPNEQNIWSPDNISSTRSLGLELSYTQSVKLGEWKIIIDPILNYNHTINTADGVNEGNQLLYNPSLNTRLHIAAEWKNWIANTSHSYTSQRYQSLDNVAVLDPYQIVDVEFSYLLDLSTINGNINIGVKNIFDQSYELVRFYPQALRSIYLGINIKI